MCAMCMLGVWGGQREHQIPWNCSYCWLLAAIWLLGTKPESSAGVASTFTPPFYFLRTLPYLWNTVQPRLFPNSHNPPASVCQLTELKVWSILLDSSPCFLHLSLTKWLRWLTLKEQGFISACGFGGFSSWLIGSVILGLWLGSIYTAEFCDSLATGLIGRK